MQNRQRNPQHADREQTDQAAESVGKDHASVRAAAVRRARKPLVQHLVEPIEHRANADDHVTECAVLRFLRGRCLSSASAAARLVTVLCGRGVPIGYDEDAEDGNGDGNDLVRFDLLLKKRNTECIRKESTAVVDCREVARGRQVHGEIPASTGNCEGASDEGRHADHVAYGRGLRLADGWVECLVLDHERGLAEELDVSSPEDGQRGGKVLQAHYDEL